MKTETRVPASRRGLAGWMLFDWAAQPFFTVVTTFIFGPYFVSRMVDDPAAGQAAWGYGIAAAGVAIAILSPVLGSIADRAGPRKPWIAAFALVKIVCLSSLWFAEPGSSVVPVLIAFALASVAAEFSIVFNDSMMPRLIDKEKIGNISNIAWGLGYLGGMVLLIFVVALLAGDPDSGKTLIGLDPLFGLDPARGEDARITGPLSALWYFVFLLPLLLFTPDAKAMMPIGDAVRAGIDDLRGTFREVRQRSGILRFLIARMIYQDGVNALIALGGAFATALFAWSITEIGVYGILLNVVAIPGCLIAGRLDNIFGSKKVVIISLVMLTLATIGIVSTGPGYTLFGLVPLPGEDSGGLFGTPAEKAFICFGLLVGLAFGPAQASSRSYLARSVSVDEAGRYFGLYAFSGRATSFLAPFLVASVTALTASPRIGIAVIVLFLLSGLVLLIRTPYPADR